MTAVASRAEPARRALSSCAIPRASGPRPPATAPGRPAVGEQLPRAKQGPKSHRGSCRPAPAGLGGSGGISGVGASASRRALPAARIAPCRASSRGRSHQSCLAFTRRAPDAHHLAPAFSLGVARGALGSSSAAAPRPVFAGLGASPFFRSPHRLLPPQLARLLTQQKHLAPGHSSPVSRQRFTSSALAFALDGRPASPPTRHRPHSRRSPRNCFPGRLLGPSTPPITPRSFHSHRPSACSGPSSVSNQRPNRVARWNSQRGAAPFRRGPRLLTSDRALGELTGVTFCQCKLGKNSHEKSPIIVLPL